MTHYVPFTATRKALIIDLKKLVTSPVRNAEGVRISHLCFADYVIYAVLRGADWKKTSHLEDGANARKVLEILHFLLTNALKQATTKVPYAWTRYTKEAADLPELESLLAEALAA